MDINPIFQSAQRLFARVQHSVENKKNHTLDTTLQMTDAEHEFDSPYPLPEEVTKRYIIRRSLGKGAFGIVCLAEDRKIGRLVAIKQLVNYRRRDSEIYERFMQEARIGAQLDHPNLVNVLSLEEDENSACIIMEYLGGGSLASYIKKEKKVDIHTAVSIITGVLTGLDAAHHVMVIHRDIKPQNILFGPHGEPKISDFGVAHLPVAFGGIREDQVERQSRVIGTLCIWRLNRYQINLMTTGSIFMRLVRSFMRC